MKKGSCATSLCGSGFTVDEAPEGLGTSLTLPPSMEDERGEIEASLPPLETTGQLFGILSSLEYLTIKA